RQRLENLIDDCVQEYETARAYVVTTDWNRFKVGDQLCEDCCLRLIRSDGRCREQVHLCGDQQVVRGRRVRSFGETSRETVRLDRLVDVVEVASSRTVWIDRSSDHAIGVSHIDIERPVVLDDTHA